MAKFGANFLARFVFTADWNFLEGKLSARTSQSSDFASSTIVPQLSKCLKFEAVRSIKLIKGFEFEQTNKQTRPMHVLLFTEWFIIIV